MGCHTWFYRKIERTQEEANESCLRLLKTARNCHWKIFRRPTSYRGIDWTEDNYTTKETSLNHINVLNRQIKAIHNGNYQRAVWNKQGDDDLTQYVDGRGLYIEDTGFHDAFRRGGYPEDMLFSLEETLKYMEDNDSIITYSYFVREKPEIPCINGLVDGEKPVYYEVEREENKLLAIERLHEFWEKFPEGMICFG